MHTLLVDVETSPNLCWSFGLRNAFISWDAVEQPSRVMSFAARWLDGDRTYFYAEWKQGRREMLKALGDLLNCADVVIHFNGQKFDEKKINAEFWQEKLSPPSPYQRIDLWRTVIKRFDLPSSKLAYVLKAAKLPGKVESGGIGLWIAAMHGESWAHEKFERYNIQDVDAMVPLYYTLVPWIDDHPNHNTFREDGEICCPNCGSTDFQKRGWARKQRTYQRYWCKVCKTWFQDVKSVGGAKVRQVKF